MICYSYRSVKRINNTIYEIFETMDEHLWDVTECVMSRWELEGLSKKLEFLGRIDSRLVKDFALIASILHDFGKMCKDIQYNCRSSSCEVFPKHYITSASFALHLSYEIGILSPDVIENKLKDLFDRGVETISEGDAYLVFVVIPILLHNYALLRGETSVLGDIGIEIELDKECVCVFKRIVNNFIDKIKTKLGRDILEKLINLLDSNIVSLSVIPGILYSVLFNLKMSYWKYVSESMIGILNICDGLVAHRNRYLRFIGS